MLAAKWMVAIRPGPKYGECGAILVPLWRAISATCSIALTPPILVMLGWM